MPFWKNLTAEQEDALHKFKMERRKNAPYWWPDAQTLMQVFLAVSIVGMVGYILVQLFRGGEVKIDASARDLVMVIIGIILGAFKDVYGFNYGGSAAEKQNRETINRRVETQDKIIAQSVPLLSAPEEPVIKRMVSWWSLFEESEKLAIEGAALKDDNIKAVLDKFKSGNAEVADLATLVVKGLLKEERSALIQTANTEIKS